MSKIFEAAVVLIPLVQNRSFTATGTPSRDPNSCLEILSSLLLAISFAKSGVSVIYPFKLLASSAACIWSSTSSPTVKSPLRRPSLISTTVSPANEFLAPIIRSPWVLGNNYLCCLEHCRRHPRQDHHPSPYHHASLTPPPQHSTMAHKS